MLLAKDGMPIAGEHADGGSADAMKIYILLMLIALIVGFSHVSSFHVWNRGRAKEPTAVPPESLPA
jgi:hypothetical protein